MKEDTGSSRDALTHGRRPDNLPHNRRSRFSDRIFPVLLSVILSAAMLAGFFYLRESLYHTERTVLEAAAARLAAAMQAELGSLLDSGAEMRRLLEQTEAVDYASLRQRAETMLADHPCLETITIAPGALVRYGFPEERSAESIGHDLLDNPERLQALVKAVSGKQAVVQGPSLSAEGRTLAFVRIPVFKEEMLWGFVSMTVDVEKLANALRLREEFPGLEVALLNSEEKRVGWGTPSAVNGAVVPIRAGSAVMPWTIAVGTAYPARQALKWAILLLVAGLGAVMLAVFALSRPGRAAAVRSSSMVIEPFVPGKAGTKAEAKRQPLSPEQPAPPSRDAAKKEKAASASNEVQKEILEELRPASGGPAHGQVREPVSPEVSEPSTVLIAPPVLSSEAGLGSQPISQTVPEPAAQQVPPQVSQQLPPHASQQASRQIPVQMPLQEVPQPAQRSLSVLVVDDSEVNREFILRMLALKGCRAEAAAGAESALEILKERIFDAALVDCIMPGMDGYALARYLRDHGSTLPLVAMSPRHDPEEEARCTEAGFNGLLVKPFTMSALLRTLQMIVR